MHYHIQVSSNEAESSNSYDDINGHPAIVNVDNEVIVGPVAQTRIYDEVKDIVEMPISTKTNIAYSAVKQSTL